MTIKTLPDPAAWLGDNILTELHAAIIFRLKNAFPALPSCEAYPHLRRKVAVPAVFVELTDLPPGDDPGTGQLAVIARFTAWIVYDRTMADDHLQAANLAASVALEVFKAGRFGQDVGPARIIRIAPDEYKPDLAGYTLWAVEWSHEVDLGASIWNGEGVVPNEVWLGYDPAIGADHEPDYIEISETPDV